MTGALALVPPLVAALLLVRGTPPPRAALLAYAAGVLLCFRFPVGVHDILHAQWHASLVAAEVATIILGGLALDDLARRRGTVDELGEILRRTARRPVHAVLWVTLGLTPFFESVTGFGVGAIVAVSLLRAMGVRGARVAPLALLGLVTVPWGALAPGTLVAARSSGLSFHALGVQSAVLSLPVFLLAGGAAVVLVSGWRGVGEHWPLLLRAALALWAGVTAANVLLSTSVAGVAGGLFASLVLAWPWSRFQAQGLVHATPYLILVGLLSIGQLSAALLHPVDSTWASILAHPALALALTCLAVWWRRRRDVAVGEWLSGVVRRWLPVALTTLFFVSLGGVMSASGMAAALAAAGVELGDVYVLLVPWIGGLSGFLTGSNTGANALFAAAQAQAAAALGLPVLPVVAVQNVSASLCTMSSPPRVSLALSVLEPAERDPKTSRLVLVVDALALLSLSVLSSVWLVASGNW